MSVVTAFECGAIVNPDGLRNQIAGANITGETPLVGLAPALGNEIFDTRCELTGLPPAPRGLKTSGPVVSGMISP